jgi:hypothetical protein
MGSIQGPCGQQGIFNAGGCIKALGLLSQSEGAVDALALKRHKARAPVKGVVHVVSYTVR